MIQDSLAVAYICWMPFGLECFSDFITSYQHYPAGVEHDLIIIFKGGDDTSSYLRLMAESGIAFQQLHYTSTGLDIATYYWCANQLTHTNIFFLNSRSRFFTKDWLAKFQTAFLQHPNVILSATGSWQSYSSSVFINDSFRWEKKKTVSGNLKKYKRLLKAATLWWYYFSWFPNAHLRTNAFFINRKLFLSLKINPVSSKIDAYRFESGRKGFSAQLKRLGYNLGLLSKGGNVFLEKEWAQSKIFWTSEQENLLISDNQTEFYAQSDVITKQLLSKLAWGQV